MKEQEAIERTRAVIRRQHKALSTEESYLNWLRRYIGALGQMPNALPSEKKVERFLTELALARDVSASTQNQAFNALAFYWSADGPRPQHAENNSPLGIPRTISLPRAASRDGSRSGSTQPHRHHDVKERAVDFQHAGA